MDGTERGSALHVADHIHFRIFRQERQEEFKNQKGVSFLNLQPYDLRTEIHDSSVFRTDWCSFDTLFQLGFVYSTNVTSFL